MTRNGNVETNSCGTYGSHNLHVDLHRTYITGLSRPRANRRNNFKDHWRFDDATSEANQTMRKQKSEQHKKIIEI
jgi:hypothetical protein